MAGIRIHLYKERFLHAKHITFDREIAVVGSSNLDIRSFVLNSEISLIVFDRGVTGMLAREQCRYFRSSTDLTIELWEGRPIIAKIGENLARLAGPLLWSARVALPGSSRPALQPQRLDGPLVAGRECVATSHVM